MQIDARVMESIQIDLEHGDGRGHKLNATAAAVLVDKRPPTPHTLCASFKTHKSPLWRRECDECINLPVARVRDPA